MPVFVAVQCAPCEQIQVVQKPASKKWSCRVCGTKQSLVRVFALGAAAEMRPIVQRLNALRGRRAELESLLFEALSELPDEEIRAAAQEEGLSARVPDSAALLRSTWSGFVEPTVAALPVQDDPRFVTDRDAVVAHVRAEQRANRAGSQQQNDERRKRPKDDGRDDDRRAAQHPDVVDVDDHDAGEPPLRQEVRPEPPARMGSRRAEPPSRGPVSPRASTSASAWSDFL